MEKKRIVGLIADALKARERAYVPYSHFKVGAALLSKDGTVYTGCNIENASFGATNCAERTAFFKAVSEGVTDFSGIAIVGGKGDGEITGYAYPCGICRQVMLEFCDRDFTVIIARSEKDYKVHTLKEIIPLGFSPENLQDDQ